MAGGAGNLSGFNRFTGSRVEKGNVTAAAHKVMFHIHNFTDGMGGNQRYFIFGPTLLRVAGGAHGIHEAVTPAKSLGPKLELIFTVMDEMTNPAGAGLRRSLIDDIFRSRRRYGKIVIGHFNGGFVGVTVFTKLGGR